MHPPNTAAATEKPKFLTPSLSTQRGTFLVYHAASRDMLRSGIPLPKGGAAIVNISSIEAKNGSWSSAAYSASKAGILALTKSAARELAAHGIRCNAVLPGWVDAPTKQGGDDAVKAQTLALMPIRRPAEPREILEITGGSCM
ncbi:hypothetical protein MRX96_057847 [Rhipicephalus microplus]